MAKKIKLNRGMFALVDDADFAMLNKIRWWVKKGGNTFYAQSKIKNEKGKRVLVSMHRFIMGVTDPKDVIDHKDWNGLNNQRSNLRVCTTAENLENINPAFTRWALQAAGVRLTRPKNLKPWSARVRIKGEFVAVGNFRTEREATAAYHSALKAHRQEQRSKKLKQVNGDNQLTNEKPAGQVGLL